MTSQPRGSDDAENAGSTLAQDVITVLAGPVTLHIHESAEAGYQVSNPLPILIRQGQDSYVASFFEANIHAAGDTDQEAFDNLRSLILDTFDILADTSEDDMAPVALRQWRVLQHYIAKAKHD